MTEISRIKLYSGTDPLTPPQTLVSMKTKTVASFFCKEIKMDLPQLYAKWMKCDHALLINGPEDMESKIVHCLEDSAAKAVLAGIMSGIASSGAAAVATAVETFTNNLQYCATTEVFTSIDSSCGWEDGWHPI